jgi:hypothetical protein
VASRDNIPPIHVCDQAHRLSALEHRADDHSDRITKAETALGDGRVQFAEIRKDLAQIQALLMEMRAGKQGFADKAIDAAIHWGVPAVIVALIYAIAKSGQIGGVQ